jgi:hypothetical protein
MIGVVAMPTKRQDKPERDEAHLQVTVPRRLKRALDVRAADTGRTKRSIVLEALRDAGFEVSDEEIAGPRGERE